jgi:pimeloyl-ACP methyl ester carboxylesterase
MTAGAAEAPADVVAKIASLGTRHVTPCGGGSMVWRAWREGRPLVVLHGGSGSWSRNVVPRADRFRVLAPDMPGFGESAALPALDTAAALADVMTPQPRRHRTPPLPPLRRAEAGMTPSGQTTSRCSAT